jgi:hypothetical protein
MERSASQSDTRRWESSLCVSEEDLSLLCILSHLSAARKRLSRELGKVTHGTSYFFSQHYARFISKRLPAIPFGFFLRKDVLCSTTS